MSMSVVKSLPALDDLTLFVRVSAALTGIDERLLASAGEVALGRLYFEVASERAGETFARLLAVVARRDPGEADALADAILDRSGPDVRFLARSIMLAWYLGVWYEPKLLEQHATGEDPRPPLVPSFVISSNAYRGAWAWRVAQTKPMGTSDGPFGAWAVEPAPLATFVGRECR
jgi:hypothetical protein